MNMGIDEVLEHFGYQKGSAAPAVGNWANDGTVFNRLGSLPEVLERFADPQKKIRVIFDYDPNFPRTLLQVWGMSEVGLNH